MRKTIVIKDRLHGIVKINSPLILELLASRPLRRLGKISQYGVPDEFYHLKNYYRLEHSIGVMLLLRKLQAQEEEQIAGLLHDVSHTAFSHTVDWVLASGKTEDFQDTKHKERIIKSEIGDILRKYGFNPKRIANYKQFGLLEREIPNLCADRLDYSFREFPPGIAKRCLAALTSERGKIICRDQPTAAILAKNFLWLQMNHWGGFEATSRYRLFADALRRALKIGVIKFADFWLDDEFVVKKLKVSSDLKIQKTLSALRNKSLKRYPKGKRIVYKKFRYVDPQFIVSGRLVRLSKVDSKFRQELKIAREKNAQGVTIALV